MIVVECHVWGENFHSSKIQEIEGIKLRHENEPQSIGTIGRYKNKPVPYGACLICVPQRISVENRIVWMADFINKHRQKIDSAGATDIKFEITWFGVQGNMELSSEELLKISILKIPLCMNYVHLEPDY